MKINKLMQLLKDNARANGPLPLRAEQSQDAVHLYVNDVIDANWGASAQSMIAALAGQDTGKTLHLHINSPGGDVFEARAMSAAIVAHQGRVVAYIEGVCASAATYLALAANEVRMQEGSLFMIHNSWTLAYGNKAELRDTANLLEKIDGTIIADYARKTGASEEQIVQWMDATTWFTAQEALDAKFVDAIDANTKSESAQAQWNLSAYPNAPQVEDKQPQEDLNEKVKQQIQLNRNRLRLIAPI